VPAKQDDLINKLIATVSDLVRQVSRYLPISLNALERHNRAYEELDAIRLALEEQRELVKELIIESSRHADGTNKRLDRVEEYTILVGMGKVDSRKAGEITQEVSDEHVERNLSERLVEQQRLLLTYQDNLARVKQNVAEMGYESVENSNKVKDYQNKINKITEVIDRIRQALV
jgi:hypothetical protein